MLMLQRAFWGAVKGGCVENIEILLEMAGTSGLDTDLLLCTASYDSALELGDEEVRRTVIEKMLAHDNVMSEGKYRHLGSVQQAYCSGRDECVELFMKTGMPEAEVCNVFVMIYLKGGEKSSGGRYLPYTQKEMVTDKWWNDRYEAWRRAFTNRVGVPTAPARRQLLERILAAGINVMAPDVKGDTYSGYIFLGQNNRSVDRQKLQDTC